MLGMVIAIVAVVAALAAVVIALRGASSTEGQTLEAMRNDLNLLRESSDRSLQTVTTVFSNQLRDIGASVQTGLATVNSEVANRLDAMNQNVAQRLHENAAAMASTGNSVADRIATVQSTFASLEKQVGEMSEQARALAEASRSITSLERALAAPKARGGFGETQLENLLQQVFGAHQFKMQYEFRNGDIADAVLFFPQGMVVIDSKFPLDNFRRVVGGSGEAEKKNARREFIKDVKKRIDEVAGKYIRPGEGTLPFALMYVPAENVYYEAVIRDEDGIDLYGYSVERHVMPVSPNSLYAYLHTILVGLNGMRISERAELILREIQSLQVELEKFDEEYQTLGKHLRNANVKFEDSSKTLERVERRVDGLASQVKVEDELPPAEEQRALPLENRVGLGVGGS
jgi:DNA recombination protein RmuC